MPSDSASARFAHPKAAADAVLWSLYRSKWFRDLRRSPVMREALHRRALKGDAYREADRQAEADFARFRDECGGRGLTADVFPAGRRKRALVHHVTIPYAGIEALPIKALQAAGFECISVGGRSRDYLRYDRLLGNRPGYLLSDFDDGGDADWVEEQVRTLTDTRAWLALRYKEVRVGQIVMASVLRWRMKGQLDFADPEVKGALKQALEISVRHVISAGRLLDDVKPDCLLVMDKGYSGAGELFDLALLRGIDVIHWSFGYKSNRIAFKRYNARNERDHHLAPSQEAWAAVIAAPWSAAMGAAIREEMFGVYASQDWFSTVGTQFDKQMLAPAETRRAIGLEEGKKTAVIFPHILWDGSFFAGEDLFQDYTEWLIETVKAACANDKLQWVIKLHPAHVVKSQRENYSGESAELSVLKGVVDRLPAHIKLVTPETPLSTYSLFQIADYVVTVRGTVGIEAGLFGIPTITAGTGRYDRRGFTIDSSSTDEYLRRLAELHTYEKLNRAQVELAERYAYYVFLCRPLRLECATLEYARDGKATPIVKVRCQSREDWLGSPDIRALAAWIRDGKMEDFVGAPLPAIAADAARNA